MIKAVNCSINNLAKLEKLEKKKRQAVNTYLTGLSEVAADFGVNTEINWLTLGVPDNLDQDTILAAFSVSVNKNSLTDVRHL